MRPPHDRCGCGRTVTWHEHRVSDGETTWTLQWFTDACKCGVRMTWRPEVAGIPVACSPSVPPGEVHAHQWRLTL